MMRCIELATNFVQSCDSESIDLKIWLSGITRALHRTSYKQRGSLVVRCEQYPQMEITHVAATHPRAAPASGTNPHCFGRIHTTTDFRRSNLLKTRDKWIIFPKFSVLLLTAKRRAVLASDNGTLRMNIDPMTNGTLRTVRTSRR